MVGPYHAVTTYHRSGATREYVLDYNCKFNYKFTELPSDIAEKGNIWDLHRFWCRMSLAEFLYQRLAESLLDGIDGEGNLF